MENLQATLSNINSIVWGPPLLILLIATHLFLTFRLRFIQLFLGTAIKLSFSRKREGQGDISHFGALATALAATVGTGNIVGVATAIAAGGPGAVLWMWLTGVFGIATKYAEAVLAIKYRVTRSDGSYAGGPMYVLERGLKSRALAIAFAGFTAIAAFGIGNTVQANAITRLANQTLGITSWVVGLVMAALTAFVILGGVKSIARVCQALVPSMVVFYVAGCLGIILLNLNQLPQTLFLIVDGAFNGQAAVGGFLGAGVQQAMRYGVARGLFSNESGLGSAPIIAAAAQTSHPVRQALVSSTGTFWDTVVVCALTGIALVGSGHWMDGQAGDALTKQAFAELHTVGPIVLTLSLFTFVYSTILGWCYYGEKAIEYLFGDKAVRPYRIAWVLAVFIGSVIHMQIVWDFADIANALMALPNIVALLALSGVVASETRDYMANCNPATSGRRVK